MILPLWKKSRHSIIFTELPEENLVGDFNAKFEMGHILEPTVRNENLSAVNNDNNVRAVILTTSTVIMFRSSTTGHS